MTTPDRIDLLYRLSQTISSTLNLEEVLEGIMNEVVKATRAERGFIMLTMPCKGNDSHEQLFCARRGIDQSTIDAPDFQFSRSIVEQVEREGQPILTSNAQTDERFSGRESIMMLGLRAILCVPLKTKEKILGVIYVDNRVISGIFTQSELELLMTIATHAAASVENTRLFQETQDRLQTLRLLYEITADLTSTLDFECVLTACLQRVQDVLGAKAASVLMVDGNELAFQVAIGEKSEEIKPFRIPLNQGIAGWAVAHGQGVIVNDARADPRFYSTTDSETGFVTECLLAAPLMINERAIGVIEVFNKPAGFAHADLELLSTIAHSAAIAIENARLYETAVEKGRMERELQVARNVQISLLPTHDPQLPGWEFASRWIPARQVSGDYYDFISLKNDCIGLVIADVTDKGMPAALFMAFARSIVRASVDEAPTPLEGIRHANRLICTDSTYGLYVTLFYALLDPTHHEITYVNAGHNPALLYHSQTGQLTRLIATGMPLGVEVGSPFDQHTVKLNPGDFIVLYTDGITEALNDQEQVFGLERLETVLMENPNDPADKIIKTIEQAINTYASADAPTDDRTILVAKCLSSQAEEVST